MNNTTNSNQHTGRKYLKIGVILMKRIKKLLAVALACASIGSAIIPMVATSVSAASSIPSLSDYSRNAYDTSFLVKADRVKTTPRFKTGTNMQKVYFVAWSQRGWVPANSNGIMYTETKWVDYSAAYIRWCFNKAGVTYPFSSKGNWYITPYDMAFKKQYITYTKLAENKAKSGWFKTAVNQSQIRNVDATTIKYRIGGVVYFSYDNGKNFSHGGIVTSNGNGVVTYISGNSGNNHGVNINSFKIKDANKYVMAYVEY